MPTDPTPNPIDYARPGTVRRRRSQPRFLWQFVSVMLLLVLGVLMLLPQLGRAREPANRIKCQSNLRQIGQALQMYANDNGGKLPDDFPTLPANEDLSPAVFVCPSTSEVPATGPTTQAVVQAMKQPGTVSYLYLGKGLTSGDLIPDVVLAYEPMSNHDGAGMNVLFGDGHVEWIEGAIAKKLLNQFSSGKRPVKFASPTSEPGK